MFLFNLIVIYIINIIYLNIYYNFFMQSFKKIHKKKIFKLNSKYIRSNINRFKLNTFYVICHETRYSTPNEMNELKKILYKRKFEGTKIRIVRQATVPLFKKSKNSRMGKGIGKFKNFSYFLKKGSILYLIQEKNATAVELELRLFLYNLAVKKSTIKVSVHYFSNNPDPFDKKFNSDQLF